MMSSGSRSTYCHNFRTNTREETNLQQQGAVSKQCDVCESGVRFSSTTLLLMMQLATFHGRCFGMLVCPGRHVKHSDMQLIGMVSIVVTFRLIFVRTILFTLISAIFTTSGCFRRQL